MFKSRRLLANISTKKLLQVSELSIKIKQDGVIGYSCVDYTNEFVSIR